MKKISTLITTTILAIASTNSLNTLFINNTNNKIKTSIKNENNNWKINEIKSLTTDRNRNIYALVNNTVYKCLAEQTEFEKMIVPKEFANGKFIKTDIDNSLWEVDNDNPNFIKPKDDKGIDVNGKRLIDVGTPTFLTDGTNKEYVDKKQDKLIAGENIKIENNVISATGGTSNSLWELDPNSQNIIQPKEKRIITSNNTRIVDIADPTEPQDAVNKRYVDNKIQPIPNIPQWKW